MLQGFNLETTWNKRNQGFTLVELSIVIAIIGLLTASIVGGMSYVNSAKISNAITLTQDISTAVNAFKQQYHLYPGDMYITNEVPNVRSECLGGNAKGGNRNGQIEVGTNYQGETACVAEVIYRAGLGNVGQVNSIPTFTTYYGNAYVMATTFSAVGSGSFPPSITHIIELTNITCDVAITIDNKIDDGNLSTGKVQSPSPYNTSCVSGSNVITTLDVAL